MHSSTITCARRAARGKADGSLHEVTALALATAPLKALKERNKLNIGDVDDVVLGCVDPVGEAGGDIARMAALNAGYGETVPGVQINRFCASGLDAVNFAAAQVMSGQHSLTIGGGVESMSRVGMLSSGAAWPMDPSIAVPSYFMPQGISADLIATKYGFSRDDVDAYAVESQKRAAKAWDEGYFKNSVVPVKDINGLTILDKDEHMRPGTTMQSLAQLQPSFVQIGEMGGFDAVAVQALSRDRERHSRASRRQLVRHRRWRGRRADRLEGSGRQGRPEAAREDPRLRQYRLRAGDHADRPGRRDEEGAGALRHEAVGHRSVRAQRGLRLGRAALSAGVRHRLARRSTSMAARSRSAIRSARPAR